MTKLQLTGTQQHIVDNLPVDGSYTDAYTVCKQRRTRMKLNNSGVTEPQITAGGVVTCWWMFRLTPLGISMRSK